MGVNLIKNPLTKFFNQLLIIEDKFLTLNNIKAYLEIIKCIHHISGLSATS